MKYIKSFNESYSDDITNLNLKYTEDKKSIVKEYENKLNNSLLYLSDNYELTLLGSLESDIKENYLLYKLIVKKENLNIKELLELFKKSKDKVYFDTECNLVLRDIYSMGKYNTGYNHDHIKELEDLEYYLNNDSLRHTEQLSYYQINFIIF